ncbi:MAG: insulinase family protein [Planctomycetes bacterium]|nr:insulinase family protein [Planctomycetota bacterium]
MRSSPFAVPVRRAALALLVALVACSAPTSSSSSATGDASTAPSAAVAGYADAVAARAPVAPRPWPYEASDIPVDPRMHFGALENGLRWVWMENGEPEHRSYLRLHVDVGSEAERDDEQGMAHFLEHMAFNGSEHFASGDLVRWFQEHGMSFGAHVNASTWFDETIYKIDLPESDEQSLVEGLAVLRDFAGGLLLQEEEVRKEVGVIDGEERERDSPQLRLQFDLIERLLDGTRFADRLPIGKADVRAKFTAESVRAFYERWYRPDLMTVVLVGDLGGLDPEPLVRDAFADLTRPERVPLPDPGRPTFAHDAFALYHDEVPSVNVVVARLRPWEPEPRTVEQLREDVPLRLARRMLNTRFSEAARKPDSPFLGAFVGSAEQMEVIDGETLGISCEPARWKEALAAGEQGLRAALEHGFQQSELDEEIADWTRSLDDAVLREPTRASGSYVNGILAAAGSSDTVPRDASTNRDILRPALDAATPEACHAALVEAWAEGHDAIYAMGGLDLGDDAGAQLEAALEESRAVDVAAPEEKAQDAFAYASSPDVRGEITARDHVDDLDLERVTFANGVRLTVKSTDFQQQQVLVGCSLGEGLLALDPEDAAGVGFMTALAPLAMIGTGAHDVDALRRLTAGRQAGAPAIGADEDRIALQASTTPDDLLFQLEILCAYLTDPGWRTDALEQARTKILPLVYQQLEHQPQGPIAREFMPALHGGDPRFGLPSQEDALTITMDVIRAWLGPQLANGPLEVVIVGDVDVDAVVDAAARTLGVLPERRALRPYDNNRVVALVDGVRQEHAITTAIPDATLQIFCRATDGRDARTRRLLRMLGIVLADRVREIVREELGEAYSPSAQAVPSQVYPGVGFVVIGSSAAPERREAVLDACLKVAEDLGRDGVTSEELERLRQPELKGLRDAMRQNGFWMSNLGDAQARPETLDDLRDLVDTYESMSTEELSALAAEVLVHDRASWVVVTPAQAGP